MDNGDLGNTVYELAGKAKETVGDVTVNDRLEAEGAAQEENADAKQALDNAAEDVKETEAQKQFLED